MGTFTEIFRIVCVHCDLIQSSIESTRQIIKPMNRFFTPILIALVFEIALNSYSYLQRLDRYGKFDTPSRHMCRRVFGTEIKDFTRHCTAQEIFRTFFGWQTT